MILLDVVGIIAFSISGFILAVRKKLDILGIFNISLITAVGGGLIRDIILKKDIFIFNNLYPLSVAILTTLFLLFIFKYNHKIFLSEGNKAFNFFDAVGLSTFAYYGTIVAFSYDINIYGIIFLGALTAVGGGAIRDVLLNRIPNIFRNDFYASVAIIVSILEYLNLKYSVMQESSYIIIIIGIFIRLLAIHKKYGLPVLKLKV
jgi:uncharacterized membrane protein YeiH